MSKSAISTERNLHQWLLVMATLVAGFFSFSGYAETISYTQPQVARTELVFRIQEFGQSTIHFYSTLRKPSVNNVLAIFPAFDSQHVLLTYNLLNQIKFDFISTRLFTFAQPHKFRVRKIPQRSTDNIPHLFIG